MRTREEWEALERETVHLAATRTPWPEMERSLRNRHREMWTPPVKVEYEYLEYELPAKGDICR